MQGKRLERVNQLIKEEISTVLQRELKDPRLGFVTVTEVDVTPDLKYAKVYVSVLGPEEQLGLLARRARERPRDSSGTGSGAIWTCGSPRNWRSVPTAPWSMPRISSPCWRICAYEPQEPESP